MAMKNIHDEDIEELEKTHNDRKFILQKDGTSWCATFEDFINLHHSLAGFGDTPVHAMLDLMSNNNNNNKT